MSASGSPRAPALPIEEHSWELLDQVGDGVAVAERDGTLLYCSASLGRQLVGTPVLALFEHDQRGALLALQQAVLADDAVQRSNTVRANGTPVRVVLRGLALDGTRHLVWSFTHLGEGAGRDQAPLDPRFAMVERSTDFGFWEFDLRRDEITWWNDWCARVEIDPCGGPGHLARWLAQVHPDDRHFKAGVEAMLDGRRDLYESEYRVRTRGGAWRWIMNHGRATVRDAAGRVLHVTGVSIDIDARKQAELALRASEARLDAAVGGTEIGLWESYDDGSFRWINDWSGLRDLDSAPGLNHQRAWRERIHPDDIHQYAALVGDNYKRVTAHWVNEYRIKTRSGKWRWLHERGKVVARNPDGSARTLVGVCFDIDARKRMEDALRIAEQRYDIAINAAKLPVWEWDLEKDVFCGNVHWHRAVGYQLDAEQARQRTETGFSDLHPDDLPQIAVDWAEHLQSGNETFEREFRIRTPAGDYKWMLTRGYVTARDALGTPLKMAGIGLDIDARKRMELALRDSETRLETAIWGANLGLWDWDVQRDAIVWLSDWQTFFGAADLPATRGEWLERLHPRDRERQLADDAALQGGGRDRRENDYRIRDLRGEWRWVDVRTRVIERDAAGRARRIVGACIDVDARRQAEELLRTQAMILETMREGVALIGADGRIEFTNRACDRMFGREPGELAATPIADLLLAGRRRSSRGAAIERLLRRYDARGDRRSVGLQRRDGSRFAAEVLSGSIELHGERKTLVVLQDVSERKHLEREITEIAHQERRRLGSDLHDGLGQELTGIALLLRGLATRIDAAHAAFAPELDEIIALVNHAIQSTRAMALGLSPITVHRGGLVSALTTLAAWARSTYGIAVQLRLTTPWALTLDEPGSMHMYLIAQEAVINAAKHGAARAVTVSLRTTRGAVSLSVADDGVGIPQPAPGGGGMGLKIMEYRAGILGGTLQIRPRKPGGTRVRCVCPQPQRA